MHRSKNNIRRCFNKVANHYDANCQLQMAVATQLISILNSANTTYKNIVDIGCGTGIVTQQLLDNISYDNLIAIDLSDQLLHKTKQNIHLNNHIIQADFDNLPITHDYVDLLFSNMVLQWSLNITVSLNEMLRVLKPQGTIAISLPIDGTFFELQFCQKLMGDIQHNQFISSADMSSLLNEKNLTILNIQKVHYTFYFNNLVTLIRSIKNTGANHSINVNYHGLKTSKYLQQLEQHYFDHFASTEKLPLTYSIIFIIAQKSI